MRIVDLKSLDRAGRQQAAEILVAAFGEHWPDAWPSLEDALEEVEESFGEGRLSRAAMDEGGQVMGWIGGIREYNGHAWELHPLAVDPQHQKRGIGTALVRDFEEQVRSRGGSGVYLGADDEANLTSLAGIDLYPNVLEQAASIRNLKRHPFGFYQKVGYTIVGVIPDANGFGKPDILMAKRL
ncbi:MAG: GNAT family N-acetyltransferase [Anaerolineales bacterium]